jgi:hypothetical protein
MLYFQKVFEASCGDALQGPAHSPVRAVSATLTILSHLHCRSSTCCTSCAFLSRYDASISFPAATMAQILVVSDLSTFGVSAIMSSVLFVNLRGRKQQGHANIALNVRQHNHSQTRIVLVQTGYARRNPTDTEPGNAEIGIKPPLCAQQQTQHMKKSLYAHHGDRKDLPAGTSQCYLRSGQNGEDTDDSIRAPSFQKSKTTENARHAWRRNGREQGYVKHMMLAGRSWNFNWKGINPNRSCGIKVDWAPTASSQLPNQ